MLVKVFVYLILIVFNFNCVFLSSLLIIVLLCFFHCIVIFIVVKFVL